MDGAKLSGKDKRFFLVEHLLNVGLYVFHPAGSSVDGSVIGVGDGARTGLKDSGVVLVAIEGVNGICWTGVSEGDKEGTGEVSPRGADSRRRELR
jgi:hypothetical protein